MIFIKNFFSKLVVTGTAQQKRQQFDAILFVLDQSSHVLGYQLTRTKSLAEVRTLLQNIATQGKVASIHTDTCCSEKRELTEIFGVNVNIKLDTFHAINRIIRTVQKTSSLQGSSRTDFMASVKLIVRDKNDRTSKSRSMPTPSPDQIVEHITDVKNRFEPKLQQATINALTQLTKHATNGCLR